ncbi:hypothetical protein RLIN73S_01350 [Rhodanobacter lindaniclasticus]
MIGAAAQPAAATSAPGPVLRDIHLPAEPSWWPPAPGWWLLGVLALLALAGLAWLWRRRHRARQRERRILGELDRLVQRHRQDGDRAALLGGMHQLLRRVAREHDAAAVRLRGEAWRQTLARVPVDAATLDRLHVLDQRLYQPPRDHDERELVEAARRWLRLAVKPSIWKSVVDVRGATDA